MMRFAIRDLVLSLSSSVSIECRSARSRKRSRCWMLASEILAYLV